MPLLRLAYERMKRHWSQSELGRRSGIRQQDISLIETGRLIPTDEQLFRLAVALRMSPPEILLKPTVLADEVEAEQLIAEREESARV